MKKKDRADSTSLASTVLLLFIIVFSSTPLVVTAQSDYSTIYAYATTEYDNTVSIINTVTNTFEAKINVGVDPYGVAVNPTGTKVYVANAASNTVSIIDTITRTVISTVNVGVKPWGVAVNPDGTKVYVANIESSSVSVIDTTTNTVTATVNVGDYPYGVAVNPTGTKVYVTNLDNSGSVDIIDTATNTIIGNVNVGRGPEGVAFNPAGTKVYVANSFSNNVSVIDTDTNSVTATIDVGEDPYGVAVTPDGTKVYVTNRGNGNASTVSVIDSSTNTIVATVNVGTYPLGVAVSPDGTKAYVVNGGGMSVIDTTTNTVIATIEISGGSSAFGQFIGPAPVQDSTQLPVADVNIDESSSSGGSSHSSDGGGGGGGSPEPAKNVEVKELSQVFVTNGKTAKFDFTKNATCVLYVSFDAKKNLGKITTIAEQLKNKSSLVSELPAGEVYKSFNVWVGNGGIASSKNVENPVICFKVKKSWVQNESIERGSITLNRYDDEKNWEQITASFSGEDEEFLYFTAAVPGFSSFAITGTATVQQAEEENTTIPAGVKSVDGNESEKAQENVDKDSSIIPKLLLVAIVALVFLVFLVILNMKKDRISGIYEKLKSDHPDTYKLILSITATVIGGLILAIVT